MMKPVVSKFQVVSCRQGACAVFLFFTALVAGGPDIRVSADNRFFYAHDTHNENESYSDLMEDWAVVTLGLGGFDAGVVYEAHLPGPEWSPDTNGQGIYERWITYKLGGFRATAGNFYAQLGRGITLKSFRNREMRYNSNIDGVRFTYTNRFFDITAIGGRPRDFSGLRLNPLQAAEARFTPAPWGYFGGTFVQSKLFSGAGVSRWGSAYARFQRDFGSIYTETATRDPGKGKTSSEDGHVFLNGTGIASYTSGNLFIGDMSILVEAAYYNNYDISEGIKVYNSPPPAIKEHSSTLTSRVTPSLNAANHTSLHGTLSYAFSDDNNVTMELTRSRAAAIGEKGGVESFIRCADFIHHEVDYWDLFTGAEVVFPEAMDWALGSGYQKTPQAGYLNFTGSNNWGISGNYSLTGTFEHQWTRIDLTGRTFYSQVYGVCIARVSSPRLVLSLSAEYTTDQYSDRAYRIGGGLNLTIHDDNEIAVFAGRRKRGKICFGGVCVSNPEFSGVEVTFTSRFGMR